MMKFWPAGAARIAELVLGFTYIIAAVLKAMDFNGFLPQIHAYQIVGSNDGLLLVAFTALFLETALGVSMVLAVPWRRIVLGLGAAMLCFFTGVILYAWLVNGLEDCGCFGKVKFTPPQAIAKNLIMLALTGLAYYGLVRDEDSKPRPRGAGLRVALAIIAAFAICLLVLPQLGTLGQRGTTGQEPDGDDPVPDSVVQGPFSGYVVHSAYGDTHDLSQGDYLVAVLSMTCDHCMETVPLLNEFVFDPTLPPLVSICLEDPEGSMEEFTMMTQPQFPLHSLGDKMLDFFPLLEDAPAPPRLVHVRDGTTVQGWDGDQIPDIDTLISALKTAGYEKNVKEE